MADGFQEVPPYAPSEERSEDEELNQDEGEEEEKDPDSGMVRSSHTFSFLYSFFFFGSR